MTDGYAKLKEQVETTYPCLGITCEEVGVYQTTAGVAKGGMSVCTDPTTTSSRNRSRRRTRASASPARRSVYTRRQRALLRVACQYAPTQLRQALLWTL